MMRGPASRALACYNEATPWLPLRAARARLHAAAPVPLGASSTSASPRWPAVPIRRPTSRGSSRWPAGPRPRAPRSSARRSCSVASTSARPRITASSRWPRPIPGPSTDAFQALAKKHGVVIVASLFEKRAAGLYHNTAAIIDADGSLLGIYRKMHIPDDPLFYEKFYFTPGDTGFRAWKTKKGTIGVLICWDQWYPEGARLTALQGARDPLLPHRHRLASRARRRSTAAPSTTSWELIQRSHAVANGCCVCVPNRVGHELVRRCRRPAGERRRPRVLGPVVRRRPRRVGGDARQHQPRGGAGRAVRSRPGRVRAHALAVPARSAHRRLRRPHAALRRRRRRRAVRRGDGRPVAPSRRGPGC